MSHPFLFAPQIGLLSCLFLHLAAPPNRAADPVQADLVLRGGRLIDGTGAPERKADLAIKGDRIVAVGSFETAPGTRTFDVEGLVVAPGFIDLHTHSDRSILSAGTRSNLNYLRQGVTTIVTGNCGSGPTDVGSFLAQVDRDGAGSNVIHLVPHGAVRESVVGTADRPASEAELKQMAALVEKGMNEGAWGISTGLIYVPSRYGDTAELVALSKVVAAHGGIYASHIRNEGSGLLQAIDEAIAIGRQAGLPAHVSHLKSSGKANWGNLQAACDRLAAARSEGLTVTADQYPYVASSTSLGAMVVPDWALQGNSKQFAALADDPEKGPRLRDAIAENLGGRDGGSSIRIARYAARPQWAGRSLAEIAEQEKKSALDVVLEIQRNGGAGAISFGMSEDDVRLGMQQPYVATASDGSAHAPGGSDRPHPRSYGTFPRKIRYALDEKVLSLEQAVHSCSGLPARILRLPDRGILREGAVADVLVFNPGTFRDVATFEEPTRYATGVEYLFVNGVPTIVRGEYRRALAGRALRLSTDGPAETVLKTGRIWTGDPARPWAEALAVRTGVVIAVGDVASIEAFRGPKTKVLEWPGAFAVPGLIDAHGHMSSLGSAIDEIDLRGVGSPDEVAALVAKRMADRPGDGWIIGQNWDQSLWPGKEFATSEPLDRVAPNRPVWLTRVDGHAGWANREAMRRAGLDAGTQPPSDGQIIRDAQGQPTGVFIDGAMGLVARAIPAPSREDVTRRLLAAQEMALAAGLTGVHDAGLSALEIDVYRQLDREGRLRIRIYGMAAPPAGGEARFVTEHKPEPFQPGRRFELRAIKLFADGAMGSRGALLFEPYADDPANTGLPLIAPDVLEATTTAALQNGWQVCTHAIGDRGNALVLDAYAAARKAVPGSHDPRLRIEHAQVVRRADVARFRELGVIASMQPAHAGTDQRWADARLGEARAQGAYAWRWFLDEQVRVAFGSDFPVEIVRPFWGLFAAVTRQNEKGEPPGGWRPEQKLTLEEALRGHTAGSAYAAFAEDRLGVLRPGLRADLSIVDRVLFEASPRDILETKVIATVIDGDVAFRSP